MTELVWTTERPTIPGPYWIEDFAGSQSIYEIDFVNGELVVVDNHWTFSFTPLHYVLIAGPIPKPVDKGGAA